MAIMRPCPEDEARLKGVDYLQRAEALYAQAEATKASGSDFLVPGGR